MRREESPDLVSGTVVQRWSSQARRKIKGCKCTRSQKLAGALLCLRFSLFFPSRHPSWLFDLSVECQFAHCRKEVTAGVQQHAILYIKDLICCISPLSLVKVALWRNGDTRLNVSAKNNLTTIPKKTLEYLLPWKNDAQMFLLKLKN